MVEDLVAAAAGLADTDTALEHGPQATWRVALIVDRGAPLEALEPHVTQKLPAQQDGQLGKPGAPNQQRFDIGRRPTHPHVSVAIKACIRHSPDDPPSGPRLRPNKGLGNGGRWP